MDPSFSRQATEPYPSQLLHPEDAERINDSINIVGYAGAHGVAAGFWIPDQKQYDEIANIVAGLDPERGDRLYSERQPHGGEPAFTDEQIATLRNDPTSYQRVERLRQKGLIDLFEYADLLATLKGIPVTHADADSRQLNDILESPLLAAGDRENEIDELRETQAVNIIIKDAASGALPDLPSHQGQKPTYALLFGKYHFDTNRDLAAPTIPERFAQLGLHMQTVELLDMTSRTTKVKGLTNFLLASMFGVRRRGDPEIEKMLDS